MSKYSCKHQKRVEVKTEVYNPYIKNGALGPSYA